MSFEQFNVIYVFSLDYFKKKNVSSLDNDTNSFTHHYCNGLKQLHMRPCNGLKQLHMRPCLEYYSATHLCILEMIIKQAFKEHYTYSLKQNKLY